MGARLPNRPDFARVGATLPLAVLAVASESAAYLPEQVGDALADGLAGTSWAAAGLAVWTRAARARVAALMLAVGVSWLLGGFDGSLAFLHRGPLVHLLFAYPTGRLTGTVERVVVVAAYVDGAVSAIGADPTVTLVLGAAVAAAALVHLAGATGVTYRSYTVPVLAAIAVFGVLAVGALLHLADVDGAHEALLAYEAVLVLAAVALAINLRAERWTAGTVTDLVVEIGGLAEGALLRDSLRVGVGDPTLVVAYPDGPGYVDELRRPVDLTAPGPARALTEVADDGGVVALVSHAPGALDDPQLADSVASCVRLTVANAALDADLRVQAEQVAASRRRLLDAAAAQRRDVAARLRNTVDAELQAAERCLAGDAPAGVAERLETVRDQIERHAAGLGPAGLAEGGLRAALAALADGSGLPVALDCPGRRFDPALEQAAWYVCSEALANAMKHAGAAALSVAVTVAGSDLRVEIHDDGRGGGDPGGSGLDGIRERLAVLGGRLEVDSPPGQGTTVAATLPLAQ